MLNVRDKAIDQIHAALFVDFDNIFISLSEQDSDIADHFASNPDLWLKWLEELMPVIYSDGSAQKRRILFRRCYLNPQSFSDYRPFFIRNAFEVIDCPPLTTRGKTSTDIHMVMDILDALNHPTHLDEFIILSGDADFTPVLLRLRKHARRSVVLSAGYVSPAYKASADYLINQEVFIQEALGIAEPEEELELELPEGAIDEDIIPLLESMAERLYSEADYPGGLEASDLLAIYKEFEEFRQGTHWLGFHSLRRLTQAIVSQRDDLTIVEDDPWRIARVDLDNGIDLLQSSVSGEDISETARTFQNEKVEIAKTIRTYVKQSKEPVKMATLASNIHDQFGHQTSETNWFGSGGFKNLLTQLDLKGLKILSKAPGYVYDPERHKEPLLSESKQRPVVVSKPSDLFASTYPELAPLARKIKQLTDTPYLMPEHYAVLLREIARAINEGGYQFTHTSKIVRDRCVEKGAPVPRSAAHFVLNGIRHTGYRYGQDPPEEPLRLGEALVKNTINLCEAAQFTPTEEEVKQINDWILSKLSAS